MKATGSPYVGMLQKAGAVMAWLGFSTLTLVILIQVFEISRILGHLLIPANFAQEVASRWRPVVVSNTVLLGGAVAWLWSVVYTLNRFLGTAASGPHALRKAAGPLLAAGLVIVGLYGAEHWLTVVVN